MECGFTNLATCIPEKLVEYFVAILNAPLQPFLYLAKALLTEPVGTSIFIPIWAIIVYILSLFYGLFVMCAGFNMIISGYNSEKRERAKEWLKNVLLMIFFVQASYYIYEILIEISASLSTGIINLINPDFFLITIDNLPNIGMEFALYFVYLIALLVNVILLTLRYIIVSAGVILFPIGVFLYFLPPLKEYGKLIVNVLMVVIFLPFFLAIILLSSSMLVDVGVFAGYKMILMVGAFSMMSSAIILLILFAVMKSAFAVLGSDAGRAVKMITKAV